ncbi:MAG: hypothetical protein FK734_03605 [Asgard group archaeon]|nr:hypothetical protein [Asgard group archaeon]
MNFQSKKLKTMAVIFLVLPFVSLIALQIDIAAAAESPTVVITEVTTTSSWKIDAYVEISLPGFDYDYYTQYVRMYLNQSLDTIIDNSYGSYNATKTLTRQSEETIETHILSPSLYDGTNDDSAYYNVTILAITNTAVKSDLVQWDGGYIYVDTGLPDIIFINPNVALQKVWGLFDVKVEVTDISNISKVEFYIDSVLKNTIKNTDPNRTIFTWQWIPSRDTRGQHTIMVKAFDDSIALNSEEKAFTVENVGPKITYKEPIPSYIDSNDTILINATLIDSNASYNISSVTIHHAYDDVWQNITIGSINQKEYNLTFNFNMVPVGTKISWEIIVNNTAGQYQVFRNETLQYYVRYSVYPDHILPKGEVEFDSQVVVDNPVIVKVNVTEQSPVSLCQLNYQISTDDWEDISMVKTLSGDNDTWQYFEYEFIQTLPIFTIIRFNIWLNDSGNNILELNNKGHNYVIRIIPDDLIAPNVTLTSQPTTPITRNLNITITVEVEDDSEITQVILYYTINGNPTSIVMTKTSETTWVASFILEASIGDKLQIWVEAMDEYYNSGTSEVLQYTVEIDKGGVNHSNFLLWLMFIVLIILPFVITLLILKPQR